jgi:hypothetical protein
MSPFTGAVRDMASVLLARLLTRVDMKAPLRSFLRWSHDIITSSQDDPATVFLLPGIMSSLAAIFKVGAGLYHSSFCLVGLEFEEQCSLILIVENCTIGEQ